MRTTVWLYSTMLSSVHASTCRTWQALLRAIGSTTRIGIDVQVHYGERIGLDRPQGVLPDAPSSSDYDAIHKAWTGMSGVRVRVPEPAAAGTYGGVVRQWLGYPREALLLLSFRPRRNRITSG